jgi:outer membrane receptor protein involved in Fe transport
MKREFILFLAAFSLTTNGVKADGISTHGNDTIRTFNMDEVVVTSSTKETNDLHKLPGSVTVLSPQMITARQIDALKDVSSSVPNLYMPDYGSKLTSAIYIRGIGARSSGQSVGLYVDNIPYLDKSAFDFELTDIQRIEILRGPQGVLYGRNAMGGIVNIHTLSPFNFQGTKLSVSGGNYGQFKAKASHYNKPGKNTGLSISAYYDRNDGYFTNQYTEKKADREESAGGRIKFDWLITPNFRAAYSFSYDHVDQGAFPYGKYDSTTCKIAPVNINDPCSYTRNMLSSHLSLEYRTDRFILTGTTGYQWLKDDMRMDQDYDTLSIFTLNQKQKQKAISEEITIRSNTKDNYQWSFGLFGFYNGLKTEGPVTFKKDGISSDLQPVFDRLEETYPGMPSFVILNKELYIPGTFDTPAYGAALFHQSTINNLFTDGLSLTAGIRLDYEKQEMKYRSNAKMNLGMRRGEMPQPMDISSMYEETVIDFSASQDFLQLLPKVSLKYEYTPSTFMYISVAKGYKAGGYNVQLSANVMKAQMQYDMMSAFQSMMPGVEIRKPEPIENVVAYKPEQSWNYELGVRSELIHDLLQAELTFFYMDIRDIQLTQFVSSGNGRILTNAGKAESFGAELALRAQLLPGWNADLNYGYTHATFKDYNNGQENFAGNYIPYTPRHTLSAGSQYTKLLRSRLIDQFTASVQLAGAGKIFWSEANDFAQNFYCQLNAKVGIRKGMVNFNLWGRNLTGTKYSAFYFESFDQPFMQLGKPLQFGAELTIAF